MSRVAEMRRLTEDMLASCDQRVAEISDRQVAIASVRRDVRQNVAGLHATRLENAVNLHRSLVAGAGERRTALSRSIAEMRRHRKVAAASQQSWLAGATSDRRAAVQAMRSDTRREMRALAAARVTHEAKQRADLFRDRADLFEQVANLMGGIHAARVQMAAEQADVLQREHVQLAADVAGFLKETGDARGAMSKAQRDELASHRGALHAEVATSIAGFHADRVALSTDLAALHDAWQQFATTIAGRRSNPRKTRVKRDERAPNPTSKAASQGTEPRARRSPSDDAVFSYLADHPDGVSVIDLVDRFATSHVRLTQVLSRLIDESKARKDGELYFAT